MSDLLAVLDRIDAVAREMAYQSRRFDAIAERLGVVEKFTVAEVARMFDVSRNTVRARFATVMERVPGGKKDWIPAEAVRNAFVDSRIVKSSKRRQKTRART